MENAVLDLNCPLCGCEVSWPRRLFGGHAWASWACPGCSATLRWQWWWNIPFSIVMVSLLFLGRLFLPSRIVLALLLLIGAGFTLLGQRVRIASIPPRRCHGCGYLRTGLAPDAPCPECGKVPAV